MAETEIKTVIKISTEIEGDRGGTVNYRFDRLGEPVPVTSDKKFSFDLESLPSRPFALSERCGAVFVAHLNVIVLIELGLFVAIIEAVALPFELLGFARLFRVVVPIELLGFALLIDAVIVLIELGVFVVIFEAVSVTIEFS
nr:hypothetical protein [Tanacetum cinerariifolium]